MAENYLWDNNPSHNPRSDVENPSPAANVNAPPNSSAKCNTFLTSKAVKLALGLTAVAGAVALGVVLGLNSSSDEPEVVQAASSATSVKSSLVADDNESGKKTKSTKQEFYSSSGPLEAKVRMVTPSITDGYETCSDLEKDITEALKLYMSNYINSEAETNEMYAKCDPDNENWYWDYYGYDDYYYRDSNNETDTANETVTKKKKMPRSSIKQTRSSLPLSLQKQTRSSNQSDHKNQVHKDKKTSRAKRNGGAEGSGFEQNSQNDNVNEKDKVDRKSVV